MNSTNYSARLEEEMLRIEEEFQESVELLMQQAVREASHVTFAQLEDAENMAKDYMNFYDYEDAHMEIEDQATRYEGTMMKNVNRARLQALWRVVENTACAVADSVYDHIHADEGTAGNDDLLK